LHTIGDIAGEPSRRWVSITARCCSRMKSSARAGSTHATLPSCGILLRRTRGCRFGGIAATDGTADSEQRRYVATTRIEAFSDGVFAIAITLAVIDLAIGHSGSALPRVLDAWPSCLAYLVSFLTIGAAWLVQLCDYPGMGTSGSPPGSGTTTTGDLQ
jgi:hypothetical protein